jgi:DHA1 family bicyclomycin/chloramphenicol resistance-like MFS transporter
MPNSRGVVVLLGLLTMISAFSVDESLPGLPRVAEALHASSGLVEATLAAFVAPFGAGQLVVGPLSDRYGRRPVLLAGLCVFSLAGLACTLAPTIGALLAARVVQGLGASAGVVTARAIVRDITADRARAATLQGYLSAIGALGPILGPFVGAGLIAVFSWRALYGVLAALGVALLVASAFGLPETATGKPGSVREAYARVLRRRRVPALAAVVAATYGGYFSLITGSPFVLIGEMHVPTAFYAAAFAINACALLAGSFTTARLARRVGAERLFATGVALVFALGLVALVLDALFPYPAVFVAIFAFVGFAYGLVVPSAYAAALAEAHGDAGLVSGLLGAAQWVVGGAYSALAAALPLPAGAAVGVAVAIAMMVAALAYVVSRRR